ncbi:MAG: Rpn family recombination-promoting nuclease/putative transposase, partial [Deltaproteobacteria bacterium]|nr:Rpn family recombination-promoting nuclease/putative transposase [Deltaproteobacteria bacterium]
MSASNKLKYRFTHDTLFKMLFCEHLDLLKRLVAAMLDVPIDSFKNFVVTNSEVTPDMLGDKFCRLDINMLIDGKTVNLEVQVKDEGDYWERSLYNWSILYASSLKKGQPYSSLAP